MNATFHVTNATLLLHRLEMLDEDQARRVRQHLESCDACRELDASSSPLEGPEGDTLGHVPASILARWSRARLELRGVERALVRSHLEDCVDCRQDLELVGQSPELPVVSELELAGNLAGHYAEFVASTEAPPGDSSETAMPRWSIRVVQGSARRSSARERLYLGWALAASIAVAVLASVGPLRQAFGPEPQVARRDTSSTKSGIEAPVDLALEVVRPPRALPSPGSNTRRAPTTRIDIAPGSDLMQLTLTELPPGDDIQIEVFSNTGTRLATEQVDAKELEHGGVLRMRAFGEFTPGSYLLRLRGSGAGDTAATGSVEYPIEVGIAAGKDTTTR